jgi:hypothetical protein
MGGGLMPKKGVATYEEAMEILSELARNGDVRAAVALAGHLRKESSDGDKQPDRSKIVELAGRRASRAS